MAADLTSSVRSGPGGVNFRVRTRSCGLAMTTIVNLSILRRYSCNFLLSIFTAAPPASDLHSLRRARPQLPAGLGWRGDSSSPRYELSPP